jgi:hypothetical protein
MKKFIFQIIKFMTLMMTTIFIMVGGTICIISKASFKITPDINILILGDSHTETAIDDAIFRNSCNLSQSGTAYLYSYCKLKKILKKNPHIDTVFLSFYYGALLKGIEDNWIMNEDVLATRVASYITLLGKEEIAVYTNKIALLNAILKIPTRGIGSIITYCRKGDIDFTNIGGYVKLDRDCLQRDIKLQNANNQVVGGGGGESFLQKKYLIKIAYLCFENNVKLILISTPTYRPEQYDQMDKLKEYHAKYLHHVDFVDYSNFVLPDSCYGDIGHLNYKGAEIFSRYLQEQYN